MTNPFYTPATMNYPSSPAPAPGTTANGLAASGAPVGIDPTAFINTPGNMNYGDAGWTPPGNGTDFGNVMNNFNLGAQGVLGLAGAYNAYQQTGLMEDQLQLQTNLANTNLENAATTTNLSLANQAQGAAQLSGHAPGSAGYDQYLADNQVQVSGAPVG